VPLSEEADDVVSSPAKKASSPSRNVGLWRMGLSGFAGTFWAGVLGVVARSDDESFSWRIQTTGLRFEGEAMIAVLVGRQGAPGAFLYPGAGMRPEWFPSDRLGNQDKGWERCRRPVGQERSALTEFLR
jgi:hypothetical protein